MCPAYTPQVIQILRDAYSTAGLDIYLCPYGCLPTGYERGVIEVVPNTKSRAGLGELSDGGLYDIFTAEFGAPHSPAFEAARRNFIISEAGYAIASYLLQVWGSVGRSVGEGVESRGHAQRSTAHTPVLWQRPTGACMSRP